MAGSSPATGHLGYWRLAPRLPMIRRILLGFAALVLIIGGGFYLYLRSSLPQADGRIAVSGLTGTCTRGSSKAC